MPAAPCPVGRIINRLVYSVVKIFFRLETFPGNQPCFKLVDHPGQSHVLFKAKANQENPRHWLEHEVTWNNIHKAKSRYRSAVRTKNQKREQGLDEIYHDWKADNLSKSVVSNYKCFLYFKYIFSIFCELTYFRTKAFIFPALFNLNNRIVFFVEPTLLRILYNIILFQNAHNLLRAWWFEIRTMHYSQAALLYTTCWIDSSLGSHDWMYVQYVL